MKKVILTAVAFGCLALPASVMATPISADMTGVRSTAAGGIEVVGLGGWDGDGNNGFQISWNITQDASSMYHYTYSISGEDGSPLSKALSHWILEVTNPADSDDFTNVSQPFDSDAPKTYTSAEGNPGMPGSIYGIKWDTSNDPLNYTVSFDSLRDPVWGDFYAKDGKDGGIETVAWNTGFGSNPSGDFTGWIARPNGGEGTPPPIPEPATMLLFGTGLAGLAGFSRKRKKK